MLRVMIPHRSWKERIVSSLERTEQHSDTSSMSRAIILGQLDTNSKDLDTENDSRNFHKNIIAPTPSSDRVVRLISASLFFTGVWIEPAKDCRTKNDTREKGQGWL